MFTTAVVPYDKRYYPVSYRIAYAICWPIYVRTLLRIQRAPNIQGDSGGISNILGNDSMCDSKQKSSYEHGSDFELLPRYGKKKIGPPSSTNSNYLHLCIEVGGGIFEHLLWDVPDVDDPGFCPLQIISNTMVSTCMHMMLVVMLFTT